MPSHGHQVKSPDGKEWAALATSFQHYTEVLDSVIRKKKEIKYIQIGETKKKEWAVASAQAQIQCDDKDGVKPSGGGRDPLSWWL